MRQNLAKESIPVLRHIYKDTKKNIKKQRHIQRDKEKRQNLSKDSIPVLRQKYKDTHTKKQRQIQRDKRKDKTWQKTVSLFSRADVESRWRRQHLVEETRSTVDLLMKR